MRAVPTLSPAAYSMIADYFPPAKRATALSVYSLGIPLGPLIAGVVGFGGLIAMLLNGGMRLLGRYMRLNYRLLKPDEGEE
jgi:MFS family permease